MRDPGGVVTDHLSRVLDPGMGHESSRGELNPHPDPRFLNAVLIQQLSESHGSGQTLGTEQTVCRRSIHCQSDTSRVVQPIGDTRYRNRFGVMDHFTSWLSPNRRLGAKERQLRATQFAPVGPVEPAELRQCPTVSPDLAAYPIEQV